MDTEQPRRGGYLAEALNLHLIGLDLHTQIVRVNTGQFGDDLDAPLGFVYVERRPPGMGLEHDQRLPDGNNANE
jgi:hypothetical protein